MSRFSLIKSVVVATAVLAAVGGVSAEDCQCSPENQVVRYIVVEMPEQPAAAFATPTHGLPAEEPTAPLIVAAPGTNTTSTFTPCAPPNLDLADPVNVVPATTVELFYSPKPEEDKPGSINMTLAMNNPAVVLEYVEAISQVVCDDDMLKVTFDNSQAFDKAVSTWGEEAEAGFILITNHMGNCDVEFERGFFIANGLTSDALKKEITVTAQKEDLEKIAGTHKLGPEPRYRYRYYLYLYIYLYIYLEIYIYISTNTYI
jgi:hypothetical protein